MSRAHVQGYDSNAAQFERMGNPWLTNRERQELGNSPVSRGKQRANRKPRPCQLDYPEIKRIARALTPEELKAREQRECLTDVLRLAKQLRNSEVRECHNYPSKPPRVIKPLRERELDPWSPERLASDTERLAKQARKARADAEAVRLEQMGKQLAKLEKKMAKVLD